MRKKHGPIRADTFRVLANAGKQQAALRFMADCRRLARTRLEDRPRNSARYRALIVRLHASAELVVERLNFRSATLARSWRSMRVSSAISSRFPDPYVREWASVARKLFTTQDPVPCGQKQKISGPR